MSELQIGLSALGVLLIVFLLGLNWWQDRRVRRKMQSHFPTTEHDPLLNAHTGPVETTSRREPGMGTDTRVREAVEPHLDRVGIESDDIGEEDTPDPVCDAVIEMHFSAPVRGVDLLPYLQNLRQAGRKPVHVLVSKDQVRYSARLQATESYASLSLVVLLANRSGPLTAIEWSQLWTRAQELVERFDATIEGPEQQTVLEQAARLDDVCAALDTQVGLTLQLGRARPAAEVIAVTREMGFVVNGHRLAWMSLGHTSAHFTLAREDGAALEAGMGDITRLNLLLDVPCSPPDERAFGRMVEIGRELAARLQAELVDDQGRPLALGAEKIIDERLQVLFAQLEQAGLPAGSARAIRVFA